MSKSAPQLLCGPVLVCILNSPLPGCLQCGKVWAVWGRDHSWSRNHSLPGFVPQAWAWAWFVSWRPTSWRPPGGLYSVTAVRGLYLLTELYSVQSPTNIICLLSAGLNIKTLIICTGVGEKIINLFSLFWRNNCFPLVTFFNILSLVLSDPCRFKR